MDNTIRKYITWDLQFMQTVLADEEDISSGSTRLNYIHVEVNTTT